MWQVWDSVLAQTVWSYAHVYFRMRREWVQRQEWWRRRRQQRRRKKTHTNIHTLRRVRFLLVLMSIYLNTRYTMSPKHEHFFYGFWSCCAFRLKILKRQKRVVLVFIRHIYCIHMLFVVSCNNNEKNSRIFPFDFDISFSFIHSTAEAAFFALSSFVLFYVCILHGSSML